MDRLAHIALYTSDVVKAANFYRQAFRLEEMERSYEPGAGHNPSDEKIRQFYLSDGCMNLTLDKVPPGSAVVGIQHIGFVVDNVDETLDRWARTGVTQVAPKRTAGSHGGTRVVRGQPPTPKVGHYEAMIRGPEDLVIDLAQSGSEKCWPVHPTGEGMDKMRHIALGTENVVKTAAFFKEVFGLKETRRNQEHGEWPDDNPLPEAVYKINLTDGYMNLAIGRIGYDAFDHRIGLHHFGVKPENMDETIARLEAAGATAIGFPHRRTARQIPELGVRPDSGVQGKYRGPDGVKIDLFERGWFD